MPSHTATNCINTSDLLFLKNRSYFGARTGIGNSAVCSCAYTS